MSLNATVRRLAESPVINAGLSLAARVLLAQIFIMAGYGKIAGYAGTQGYMASMGVPGGLLPLVIALELGGGIALLAGFQTRVVAALLAGFSVVTGFIFHGGADQMNQIMLMKNLAMAGGLLVLVRTGAGAAAIDRD